MSNIVWNDGLSIEIDLIDEQHRSLISKIADLEKALRTGQGPAEIVRVLTFLMDYTRFHFGTEERNMRAHDYPALDAHLVKHEEFKTALANLSNDFREEGATLGLADSIETLLMNWFVKHIKDVDHKFGEFLRENNLTMSEADRTIGMCAVCGTDGSARITMDLGDHAVSRCSACGLVYLSGERDYDREQTHYLTDHFDSGYMRNFDPNEIADEQVSSIARALNLAGTSHDRLPAGAPVLEIGCARGHFLHRLQEQVPKRPLVGIDMSRRMTKWGAQEFGLDLRGCSFEAAELPTGSFGLIAAFDVLEHVARPEIVLSKVLKLLHPDGWAVIEVPSERTTFRWLARTAYAASGKRLAAPLRTLYHTAHLTYFTPRSLLLLLQRLGATDVLITTKEAHVTRFGRGRYGPLASGGIRAVVCLDRLLGTQAKLLCVFRRRASCRADSALVAYSQRS